MSMDEKDTRPSPEEPLPPAAESPESQESPDEAPPRPKRPIERFYDKFEGVPLKALDIFIGILIAAFIILVVLGYLKGHEII